MRILLFNFRDILHPEAGGAERMLFELFKRSVKDGNSVVWFAPQFKRAKKDEVIEGIHIKRRGNKYTVYLWAFIYYFSQFKGKVDIVFDSINTIPFFTPLFVKEKKASIIYQLGGNILEKTPFHECTDYYNGPFLIFLLSYFIFEPLTLLLYKNTSAFTISNSSKKDLQSFLFKHVYTITLGAEILYSKKYKKEGKPTLIFLGRMVGYKKPEDAIRAFDKVKQKIKNAQLWMAGAGPLLEMLKSKYKTNKAITFFGFVDTQKKYELLGKAHLLLFPSIREGWGLTVIEAALVGTPTIGYNVHGLRDVIQNNTTGFLVADPEHMGEKAAIVLQDKKELYVLSQNVFTYGRTFTWDKTYNEFEKGLAKVL